MERGNVVIGWLAALLVVAALLFLALKTVPKQSTTHVATDAATTVEAPPEAPQQPNGDLQALLNTTAAKEGDYAIAVVEPNGRTASANGDKQFVAASTYKLFIAYGVFQAVNDGSLSWSDTVFGNYSAERCFELMIIRSDNDCPETFGNRIGWQKINSMMAGLGLTNTQVKFHDNATTANDLALFLAKLQGGTLLNEADSQRLLDAMKRQQYRMGIPAGTGVETADKPGFLDGLLHDAAIVYGTKGAYVLVIMSDGSTWTALADTAREIHTFMEQQ